MEDVSGNDTGRSGDHALLVDCVRSVLSRGGKGDWRVRPGEFWCHVQPPEGRSRIQGWKLHVSATPLSAAVVLTRSAPILVEHGCAFKFAVTLARVAELVSRRTDRGAGGKFITAYPDGDEDQLRALAEELHQATSGLPGPGILCDERYRPGSLVHYRYGAFNGVPMLGNDGSYEAMLVAPDGTLVLDQRKAWFNPPAWAPRDPFTGRRATAAGGASPPKPVLLNDRYVVREVIRHSFSGGVYRAEDKHSGETVIIKQGRPHTDANLAGRDVRTARRHEAAMLERLRSSGVTPRPVELFEQQGDLFLVQQAISGTTLRQWVGDNGELDDRDTWGPPPTAVERIASGLVDLVDLVHRENLVLRDLNPSNIMVTDDDDLRLIDLELLTPVGQPVTRAYTPGYAAPEQIDAREFDAVIEPTADLYSLGATLFYLVTGIDPLLPADEPATRPRLDRIKAWLDGLGSRNPSARRFAPVIVALLHDDPGRRPGLTSVRALLAERQNTGSATRETPDAAATGAGPSADVAGSGPQRWIEDAIAYLLDTMDLAGAERLWPSQGFGASTDPLNVQHGAAGVLGALNRAAKHIPDPALTKGVVTAARWVSRQTSRESRTLPGLYFGRAGTAWALLETGQALGDQRLVGLAVEIAERLPLRWPNPDVCHGMSGAGLTQLRMWEVTGDTMFLDRAQQVADMLAAAAERRDDLVMWPVRPDFASSLAGLVHYGFAHGVAGVGAFLLAAASATGDSSYQDLAVRAAETLRTVAQVKGDAAYWTSDPNSQVGMTGWCSGSSGVGTFLARVGRHTGDARFSELAAQAAVAVYRSRWHAGTAQCHGLAGDGEFLLDLAQLTGDDRYRDWAHELAVSIYRRHALRDGRIVAPDESRTTVSADFNTGLSGVLAFLLRLSYGGDRLWLPASLATGTQAAT